MNTLIKRITLQGFKSFNKKISIPLSNGLIIFCGPNGVGKSNILDAICFVLGRTSAKSMRADRLHELIFHGGNGKQPAKYASVAIYLDNSKKTFPFEDSEVSIMRKVSRKGISNYKIQGKTVTREKVLQLLSTARIYPEGHNIVLQGDVTKIIEMSPIERRYIIDEISGIAEYNDKKNKAMRDLEAVDARLKEAEIIITQRYDIFKKLEEERNTALRYQKLQKQLQILKASLAKKKLETSEENAKKIDEDIERMEKENESLRTEIEKLEREIEEKEKNVREIADKIIALSKRVEKEKEISELRAKLLIAKDKIDSKRMEIERLNNLIEKLRAIESRREFEGKVPRAVKEILSLKLKGIYGTVANLINVPEEYHVAIEIAGGRHLYDIVVEDDKVASYCIEFLKREKIGRATFLPLNKIRPRIFRDEELLKKGGVIGVASKLIGFDKKYSPAIEFVFGSTLIVKNLNNARELGIGKARMVTLDGDLIEKSGAMTGGYYIKIHPKFVEKRTKDEIEEYLRARRLAESEIENLRKEVVELENRLKGFVVSETTKEFVELGKSRVEQEARIDELRKRRKIVYEKRLNIQTELNKLKIKRAKLDAELENARIEVEQYGPMEYLDKKISTLRNGVKKTFEELTSLGPVNFKAIEEYEKFKTEFDDYKVKYEKILEEKKAVIEMIEKIEEKRKEVFYRCLTELSKHFDGVFHKMTNGNASLGLENPEDLESGLIIEANPGGKRLLSIDAMSGGEKSLTALAFLLAIQKYKPAPFYVLDEVDAALDKENTKKVAELLKDFSKEAQFIVITHNDQTIKYGDRVYGVTMESGESKILGLEMPK
jgi:chromosome segregation protein